MKILAEPVEAAVWFKSKEKPLPVKFRYCDRVFMSIAPDHVYFCANISAACFRISFSILSC